MSSPHVYDKAKYHHETIEQHGLSEEHAANHTVVFLRWLIERQMMSDFFEQEAADILRRFRAGEVSIHQVYGWWDGCLVDDMLSEEGNAFAMHYFDFQRGRYIPDYIETLQGRLPSEFTRTTVDRPCCKTARTSGLSQEYPRAQTLGLRQQVNL